LLGELVGVDPGIDGVQYGQPRMVDRPGGELDRVGGVSFRPICLPRCGPVWPGRGKGREWLR
jgi:hypothetical protein